MTCRGLGSRPAAIGAACRTAFVLLLSWLGLPICGGAQVRTPESAGPGSVRDAELRRDIAEVMRRLDAAFDKGDAVAYLAAFEPDHPGVHALLAQRLRRLFPAGLPARGDSQNTLRRTSTILGDPRRVGPRTVVRVRHEVHAEGRPLAVAVEDSMIAFRTDGGSPVPTFVTEAPRSIDCPPADLFRCPPCNFEVGGVPGWLCVPMGRDRAQSLEASSFYLLGTDHACDVSVRIDGRQMGEGRADDAGRYAIALSQPLPAGPHQVETATSGAVQSASVEVSAAAPLTEGPFRASAAPQGLRVDWMTPGGGVQSTVVLD